MCVNKRGFSCPCNCSSTPQGTHILHAYSSLTFRKKLLKIKSRINKKPPNQHHLGLWAPLLPPPPPPPPHVMIHHFLQERKEEKRKTSQQYLGLCGFKECKAPLGPLAGSGGQQGCATFQSNQAASWACTLPSCHVLPCHVVLFCSPPTVTPPTTPTTTAVWSLLLNISKLVSSNSLSLGASLNMSKCTDDSCLVGLVKRATVCVLFIIATSRALSITVWACGLKVRLLDVLTCTRRSEKVRKCGWMNEHD